MWTPEDGYGSTKITNIEETFPLPGVGPGNEYGLSVMLKLNTHDFFCSSTESSGFKILLHSPNDSPRVGKYGQAIPGNF